MQLTEKDCTEWKLLAIDFHDRDTWGSGVRYAMRAASQLPGRGAADVDVALYLYVNQKSDDDNDNDDDDDVHTSYIMRIKYKHHISILAYHNSIRHFSEAVVFFVR